MRFDRLESELRAGIDVLRGRTEDRDLLFLRVVEKYAIVAGTENAVGSVIIRRVCVRRVKSGFDRLEGCQSIDYFTEDDTTGGKTRQFLRLSYWEHLSLDSISIYKVFPGSQFRKRPQSDQRRRHHRQTSRLG